MARWPLVFICIFLLLGLGDTAVRHWLRFDRAAILDGEIWRLFTCHWVHLGWTHTILNSAAMALVAWLMPRGSVFQWLLFWLFASVWTSIGIWFDERTALYVGASGVLHGVLLLAAWFSTWLEDIRRYLMLVIITGKLIWEQTPWYDDAHLADAIGGYVVVDAHLYGGIAAICVLLALFAKHLKSQNELNHER